MENSLDKDRNILPRAMTARLGSLTSLPFFLSSFFPLTHQQVEQVSTMPHALFRKQHVDVRELDLSTIVYSSNYPEHLPDPKLNYTPVPDEEALALLTDAFNRHPDKSAMMTELSEHPLLQTW